MHAYHRICGIGFWVRWNVANGRPTLPSALRSAGSGSTRWRAFSKRRAQQSTGGRVSPLPDRASGGNGAGLDQGAAGFDLGPAMRAIAASGIQIKPPALWHQLDKWRLSFKKNPARQRARARRRAAGRHNWRTRTAPLGSGQAGVPGRNLGQHQHGAPLRPRPRGQRCVAAVPHGHWKTTTFVAGLRHDRITAPLVIDGPMDGATFLAYVQTFLCPTLRPGDIVIADNLAATRSPVSSRPSKPPAPPSSTCRRTRPT